MVSSPMEMALFCALSKNSVKRCAGVQGGARSRRRGSRQGCGAGREVLGEARQSRERLRPRAAVSLPAWLAAREGSKHHEPKKRLVADRNGGAGKPSRHRHRTTGGRGGPLQAPHPPVSRGEPTADAPPPPPPAAPP